MSKKTGRGIGALFNDLETLYTKSSGSDAFEYIDIENIEPNPEQPRKSFDEEDLHSLAYSIKSNGILQPLIVRKCGNVYRIIAGERRWRASKIAEIDKIPCIVRDVGDNSELEIALIENIQRAELNAIEEAAGYQKLIDLFGYTQDKVSNAVGKSRSHIANMLRLNGLDPQIKAKVAQGIISVGHAKILLNIANPLDMCEAIERKSLSVRELERVVQQQRLLGFGGLEEADVAVDERRDEVTTIRDNKESLHKIAQIIEHKLGMRVAISQGARGEGKVIIKFNDMSDLDLILDLLDRCE